MSVSSCFVMKEFGDEVIGKKWICLERNTLHRVWGISEGEREPGNTMWLVFLGWVTSWANKWECYSNYFGDGIGISRNWAFGPFMVGLGTVMGESVIQHAYVL